MRSSSSEEDKSGIDEKVVYEKSNVNEKGHYDDDEETTAEEDDEVEEEEDDDEAEEEDDDEAESLRKELAEVPLGELQKLKETVGIKQYNEAVFGSSWRRKNKLSTVDHDNNKGDRKRSAEASAKKSTQIKLKKSEPMEISSKIRKFQPRKVIEKTGRVKRDPRFDDLSGTYNEALYEKSYSFLNDIRKDELNSVKKQLKKSKNKERKEKLHKLLQRMEQQNTLRDQSQKRKEKDRARKKEEIELVRKGKKVFYLKKSEKKKVELAEKYKGLKDAGQLDKYMSKKRKRNAAKEKKKLPFQKTLVD